MSGRAFGRWTLTTTRVAVLERRPVHLADRPGRQRLGSMTAKTSSHGTPQLLLHDRDDLGLGQRRHVAPGASRAPRRTPAAAGRAGSRGSGRASRTSGRAPRARRAAHVPGRLASRLAEARPRAPAARGGPDAADLASLGRAAGPRRPSLASLTGLSGTAARARSVPRSARASALFTITTRAARVVRDAVRDVAEQELLAAAHADVADDEDVAPSLVGGVDDRLRRVLVDDDRRPAALARQLLGEPLEVLGGVGGPRRLGRAGFGARRVLGHDHLQQEQLRLVALGHVGRPRRRRSRRSRAIGSHGDPAYRCGALAGHRTDSSRTRRRAKA